MASRGRGRARSKPKLETPKELIVRVWEEHMLLIIYQSEIETNLKLELYLKVKLVSAMEDWRSPDFRQKVVAQIEEAMRKARTTHRRSSNDLENHLFTKAKTREEYLSLIARLIIHFRDIAKKAQGGSAMGPDPSGAPVGGMGAMAQMQMVQDATPGVVGNQQGVYTSLHSSSSTASAMEGPETITDWRSPAYRQKVVVQIEEAIRRAGTTLTKSSSDMESHVFSKATTREEYLSLIARLIIHFRDIEKKTKKRKRTRSNERGTDSLVDETTCHARSCGKS